MTAHQYTRWFDTDKDGPPVRIGVYEGAAAGIPGEGSTLQEGFFHWNGQRWDGWGESPSAARGACPFQASVWRGVVPGDGYPFDQVRQYVADHHAGTLERLGTADVVSVGRLRVIGTSLELEFQRQAGARDPEDYKATLSKQGHEYVGSAVARIGRFASSRPTRLRAVVTPHPEDRLAVVLTLESALME